MSEIIPFSKNHRKYKNVPDKLKWAVPIHECVSRPEIKRQAKALEALVDQQMVNEDRAKRAKAISLVPKP